MPQEICVELKPELEVLSKMLTALLAADHTTELDAADEIEFTVLKTKEKGQ